MFGPCAGIVPGIVPMPGFVPMIIAAVAALGTLAAGSTAEEGVGMHRFTVCAAALAPGGDLLATGSVGGEVLVWSTTPFTPAARLVPTGRARSRVVALAFAPGGGPLAVAARDSGLVGRWDTARGSDRGALAAYTGEVYALAWAPDGRTLATVGADRGHGGGGDEEDFDDALPTLQPPTVRLWRGDERLASWAAPRGRMFTLAFAADGERLVVGAEDTVAEWSVPGGEAGRRLPLPGEPAWVGYLRDGTLCAVSSRHARCWSGDTPQDTPGARAPARAAAITMDRVVTGTFEAVEVRPRGRAEPLATVAGRAAAVLPHGDAAWIVFEDRALSLTLATGGTSPGHALKGAR